MIEAKENIYTWVGRSFAVIVFAFLASLSNHHSSSDTDYENVSVDRTAQVVDLNHSATLAKPVILPDFDDSFEGGISAGFESWQIKSDLRLSNRVVNRQFKTARLKFYAFKPNLLRLKLSYLQFTSAEDCTLIS